jgi:hypothetical protein
MHELARKSFITDLSAEKKKRELDHLIEEGTNKFLRLRMELRKFAVPRCCCSAALRIDEESVYQTVRCSLNAITQPLHCQPLLTDALTFEFSTHAGSSG